MQVLENTHTEVRRDGAVLTIAGVTDPVAARTKVAKFGDYVYRELQFGLRKAIAAKTLDELLGDKAPAVSRSWRQKQLEYSFRRGLMRDYCDFSVCTRQALVFACREHAVAIGEEAIELANDSEFGLTASIFTTDPAKARDIANQLETGGIFVNAFSVSDPRVAFGGVKKSGFGRELSHFGVREFCNAQTVWLDRK